MNVPLLSIHNLQVGFRQGADHISAVAGIDLEIQRGETFALVGESGSGKSVTALAVLRLLPQGGCIQAGRIELDGVDLLGLREIDLARIRGRRIGIVFQDPMSSLNPVMTVGRQLGEALSLHRGLRGVALQRRAIELLDQVGLPRPERHLKEYPHQLSGGMRQRVMIAIALAGEPDLLIADEPTTALDVTIQAQILELLKRLQKERGMALWLITHDLGVVAEIADRVAVMRRGEIVEAGARESFFAAPKHPYTQQLFDAMPRIDSCRRQSRPPVRTGAPPLLELRDFRVYYPIRKGLLQRTVDYVRAVDGVTLTLTKGQTLALVGESGCGKTTLGKAILNLIAHTSGQVLYDQFDITEADGEIRRRRCAEMQIIFQDPYAAMNPRMVVGDIVAEGLLALRPDMSVDERRARVDALLEAVGLPSDARLRYPHEFSGGQRQRICIARALAVSPRLIVCDEPTSALDVSVQRQIIDLLKDLREREGLSYVFISHDLAVVAELADRVAVMYQGRIVELGEAEQVLFEPRHAYTRKLLQAAPRLHRGLR